MTGKPAPHINAMAEADDDLPSNPRTDAPSIGDLAEQRYSRRDTLKMFGVLAAAIVVPSTLTGASPEEASAGLPGFESLSWSDKDAFEVAPGHKSQVVVRWGDPLTADAPALDISAQTAESQARQAGYNNDFLGFLSLPQGSSASDRGLLCVSYEYTDPHMMYPGFDGTWNAALIGIDMAAHGLGVIEVIRNADGWSYVQDSPYNRRITAETPIAISGPAAGHEWMKTATDSTGTVVLGTVNNCAGGLTPWGTWLQAEENFHGYFRGNFDAFADQKMAATYKRYGVKDASRRGWETAEARFDLDKEPNEGNRFGWIVEVDPYDPASMPVKRTALGRFKHEAATTVIAPDGRVVVYSGDDQRFEYIYKFVSRGSYSATDRAANSQLLDDGILYVAKLDAEGQGTWMPLVFGYGPLTAANGFSSQGDVLLRTREAADALGATPMDRPEDVEASPTTGKVYVMLTNNSKRTEEQIDGANPRAKNKHGQILEMVEASSDPTATEFGWELLMVCGPEGTGADYQGHADASPVSCPDNVAFDAKGNLWIATDGQIKTVGMNDAVYFCPAEGPDRGKTRQFCSGLPGGEICGPCFTPDQTTFFVAIQHPGADVKGSTLATPATRWPDYEDGMPPRPSVVAITRDDGKPIGG